MIYGDNLFPASQNRNRLGCKGAFCLSQQNVKEAAGNVTVYLKLAQHTKRNQYSELTTLFRNPLAFTCLQIE